MWGTFVVAAGHICEFSLAADLIYVVGYCSFHCQVLKPVRNYPSECRACPHDAYLSSIGAARCLGIDPRSFLANWTGQDNNMQLSLSNIHHIYWRQHILSIKMQSVCCPHMITKPRAHRHRCCSPFGCSERCYNPNQLLTLLFVVNDRYRGVKES